ncbi:hypothetical protein ATCC90586_002027 [Pythium insidiosum]|nr:hypothetical protein ATCC90586_002027 [Pythium insidiosum]
MWGLSSDMFSGIMFQLFILSPAMSWILQPGRFTPRQGFIYAVSFLILLAALAMAVQFSEQASNFYHVVGVTRDTPLAEIKRAFRTRSMDLHPDKNPSPDAAEEFNRLRLAFDVLGDADKRVLYDLYGESAVSKERAVLMVETIIQALSFYGIWAIFTYVLTLSDRAREARAWSFAGIALLFIAELNLQFAGATLPPLFFPYMTIFEFTRLLRAVFPIFMNGTRAIGGYFYRDVVHENFLIAIELLKSNKAILLGMRELQGEVASSRRRVEASKVAKPDALPPAARKRVKHDKDATPTPSPATTEGPMWTEAEQALHQPAPAVQAPPRVAIPGFVYFFAVYFVVNYFFN